MHEETVLHTRQFHSFGDTLKVDIGESGSVRFLIGNHNVQLTSAQFKELAQLQSPSKISKATACRIGDLSNPQTLDLLLNEFEAQGMPMGSPRWAEYCRERLRELSAKEETLKTLIQQNRAGQQAISDCKSQMAIAKRKALGDEARKENLEKETT